MLKLGTHHAATCPAGSTAQTLPMLPKLGCSWSISPGVLQALQNQQWHFLSFLPLLLGYSVGCNQKYVFYHHLHKLLKPAYLYLFHDTFLITPSGGYLSANEPSRHYCLTHKSTSSHCEMLHPGGGTKHSYLHIISALGQSLPTEFPEDKSSITTIGPSEEDQTLLQDHRFNRITSITSGRLQPPFNRTATITLTNRVWACILTLSG